MNHMKTLSTLVTDRGQVSIPAEIRKQMKLEAGMRVVWKLADSGECSVSVAKAQKPQGARAMRGFASTFRSPRRTRDWMAELREGEVK